ncbi:phytanoyl-CoA dioxygenase family protein [Thermoleptolyngbya sichuanensis XZ-Cy5]|uniref:phytanoyl-CoA dioxygenase family protein n=1 Tax=Thermoleptolyngbya sichuanensis TaxID=2885951 RepID=UPI00240D4426|nr:phytanoyl-CoA dioxygenase family protein [Thermoleptolyngbya sichuanensis]MDG2615473.1 phytanoyl-CoA dioxygenase family protein [Thermoleptolyngbya sichuanensis XZ-Cy5]
MAYSPLQITEDDIQRFQTDGFIILEQFIDLELVQQLRDRIEPLFRGEFETTVYPDEWHWRPGLSLPDVTREICNAWKSDRTIASVALSAEVGRISAQLAGWPGARIGQDSLWYKPPGGGKEIALHQDGAYINYLTPAEMVTCWIALDDVSLETGTLQYVRGSHRWPLLEVAGEFHAPQKDYRWAMLETAKAAGVSEPDIVPLTIPAGGCAFHHGLLWHGSGKNLSETTPRRSLGIHTISSEARFSDVPPGYIYGRYKRINDSTLDESFFPILWTQEGYRSPYLASYCRDAIALPALV